MMFRPYIVAFMAFTAVAAFAETVTVNLYAVGDTKGASSLTPSTMTLTVGQATSNTLSQLSGVSRTGYTLATNEWKASRYNNNTGNEANRVFDAAWCAENATIAVSNYKPIAAWTMLVVPVTPNRYTVVFNANGGSGTMNEQSFKYDKAKALTSNSFTKVGHTFSGWNYGGRTYADGEVVSNLTAIAGRNVMFTAVWSANTYTITLDAGEEADTPGTESVQVEYGSAFPSITLPTRSGYRFKGYYTQQNGAGDACYWANGNPCMSSLSSNATIYAWWEQNPTVTLNPNGGELMKGWTTTTNYAEGVGLRLPSASEEEIAYTNRIFEGWYYLNGTGPVTVIGPSDSGNKAFIAHWRGATYTVNFNANGGTGQGSQPDLDMTASPNLTVITALNIVRRGHTFVSWNTAADGSGVAYGDGASIAVPLTTVPGGIVTLYAQWAPNPYEVAFHPNGADGGETMDNQSFVYDVTQHLDAVAFTYTGRAFERWSSDTNYNPQTKYYLDGAEVANLTATSNAVVNLYANWTGIVYTVSFDVNGGEGAMASIACTYNVSTNLPACAFTRDGWGFKEWTNAVGEAFIDRARVTNLTATAGADVALFACWTGVTYAVTLDARDSDLRGDGVMTNAVGEEVSVLTNLYTVGDVWELPTPTNGNEHLSFGGWKYVDVQGQTCDLPDVVQPPSHGITNLVASWSWVPDALALAVDAEELPFRTFGTAGPRGRPDDPSYATNWFVQSAFAYYGETAAQSGALPVEPGGGNAYYASWLTTTVTGAGVLSFQWKCTAHARYVSEDPEEPANNTDSGDALLFGICNADGSFTEIARMEATRGWEEVVYTNSLADTVTYAWAFQYKPGDFGPNGAGRGGGTGWVDRVTWTPKGAAANVTPTHGVAHDWLRETFGLGSASDAELEAKAENDSPNGKAWPDGTSVKVWEDYWAGTNPNDPNDLFHALIAVTNGVPTITPSPDMSTGTPARVYWIQCAPTVSARYWERVRWPPDTSDPALATNRFFKVELDWEGSR